MNLILLLSVISKSKIKISTKVQFQNIDQTRLQNPDLNSASKSWPNYLNIFLCINISNTNSIKKFWFGIFKSQSHINQVSTTLVNSKKTYAVADDSANLGSNPFFTPSVMHLMDFSFGAHKCKCLNQNQVCESLLIYWQE